MSAPRSLSDEEFSAYLAKWKERFPKTYLAPILWGFAGLRLLEVRSLLWADVLVNNQPAMELKLIKTSNHQARARTLPLANNVRVEIMHHLARCNYEDGVPEPYKTFLLPGTKQTMMSERTLEWQAEMIGKQACARHITPHMLRHTFATRLLPVSNIRVVQNALGHRSIKSTERYTHPTYHDLARAIEKSSAALHPPPLPLPPEKTTTTQ